MLDGFDEIAGGLHRAALVQLNRTSLPVLLTSRADEYDKAVEVAKKDFADKIHLEDLVVTDLAGYLADGDWDPVFDQLAAHPDSPLGGTLSTPLMAGLARTVYNDTPDHDPSALLDTEQFADSDAIAEHLLDAFVPAVYENERRWDTDRVRHWLGFSLITWSDSTR